MTLTWRDPRWVASAHEWIDARLVDLGFERTGEIEQPHVNPWSTVMRVPTVDGEVWFKASADALRHEAAVVDLLSRRRPDCVPPLLAADVARGWMLMSHAGVSLRDLVSREQSLDRWFDVLGLYASVQLDLTGDVGHLLGLGVPDLRMATLPAAYEQFMDEIEAEPKFRDASSTVAELAERLAAYEIAETIQHDDLHDGQVFVLEGRNLVLDWGEACISHPFFTLAVTLEGVLAWGLDDVEGSLDTTPFRDAYLAPFAQVYGGDLANACELAKRLGWASRAVNGHVPGQDAATLARLRMFVDGRAGA